MVALLLATALAAGLPAGGFAVDPAASTLRYHIVHKLHRVEGVSNRLEGKALVKEDGTVQAMVRAPVTSFKSGDGNRDSHMAEAVDAARFSHVTFRGVARLGEGRALPAGPLAMEGEVELHGVKRPVRVALAVELRPDGALHATGTLTVSLEAHGVERPSLLFVAVDDACAVDVDLVLREERR